MARKKSAHSKKKIPLRILERRAAHLVRTVIHRGGHVPGVSTTHRRVKHKKKR